MATDNRDNLPKPEFMTEEQFEWLKKATDSLDKIRGDAKADVERYKANPRCCCPPPAASRVKNAPRRWSFCSGVSAWSLSARWLATTRTRPGTPT